MRSKQQIRLCHTLDKGMVHGELEKINKDFSRCKRCDAVIFTKGDK